MGFNCKSRESYRRPTAWILWYRSPRREILIYRATPRHVPLRNRKLLAAGCTQVARPVLLFSNLLLSILRASPQWRARLSRRWFRILVPSANSRSAVASPLHPRFTSAAGHRAPSTTLSPSPIINPRSRERARPFRRRASSCISTPELRRLKRPTPLHWVRESHSFENRTGCRSDSSECLRDTRGACVSFYWMLLMVYPF